jgi:uncharacterized OsmC-like protein
MRAACPSRTTSRVGSRPDMAPMLEYRVSAKRVDSHGSIASTKDAEIILDTDIKGRRDAFNPAELFLAAIAACMIKGIERVTPMLKFDLRGVEVKLHGVRQDSPPKMISVDYELIVDTIETDQRLELLHTNVRKYGTISNTLSGGGNDFFNSGRGGLLDRSANTEAAGCWLGGFSLRRRCGLESDQRILRLIVLKIIDVGGQLAEYRASMMLLSTESASRVPSASPFSKSAPSWPMVLVTCARQRSRTPDDRAKA